MQKNILKSLCLIALTAMSAQVFAHDVKINEDGSKTIQSENGAKVEIRADGSKVITKPDGSRVEIKADGSKSIHDHDGTTIEIKQGSRPDC